MMTAEAIESQALRYWALFNTSLPVNIGTDITPASVTAPRTPPTVSSQQERGVGTCVNSPLPRKCRSTTDNQPAPTGFAF
jgi:hypothetical protein